VVTFCNVFDDEENRDVRKPPRNTKIYVMHILNLICHVLGGGGCGIGGGGGECLF